MPPRRNQPCPCGSGRKHKHCCGKGRGKVTQEPDPGLHLPPELLEIARESEVWEADAVALPGRVEGEDRKRMVAAMVVADHVALESDVRMVSSAEPEDVARMVERAVAKAARAVGVWPASIRVRRDSVADALEPLVRDRGCEVEVSPVMEGLDDMARSLSKHLSGQDGWPAAPGPDSWAGWGLPRHFVADLFEAYVSFHRAAPWKWMDDVPPVIAEWDDGTEPWIASVMGAGLGEFGLVVHSSQEDFQDTLDRDEDALPYQALRGWVVHLGYYHQQEIPRVMVKEIARAGWKVASVAAYPYIMPILTPGGGLQRGLVRRLALLLRGVAELAKTYGRQLRAPEGGVFEWNGGGLALHIAVAPEARAAGEGPPWDLEALVQEIEEAGLETEEEIQAHLAPRVDDHNAAPQAALGGISPSQALALMREGLEGEGPLRLAEDLSLEELAASDFLANARLFLGRLDSGGKTRATVAGRLKRAFVAETLELMRLPDGYLEDLHRARRVVNEEDAWPLHILRVNLEVAGLVKLRKSAFSLTKLGRALVAPESPGRLLAHLFRSYFGEFNLDYGHRSSGGPGLQPAVPLLLWQMGVHARDWISVEELASRILPPGMGGDPEDREGGWNSGAIDLQSKVLLPLLDFGILEARQSGEPQGNRKTQESTLMRTTPLFHRFLQFHWE